MENYSLPSNAVLIGKTVRFAILSIFLLSTACASKNTDVPKWDEKDVNQKNVVVDAKTLQIDSVGIDTSTILDQELMNEQNAVTPAELLRNIPGMYR